MHIAGEAPLELSPLDAFAMQSRLLAKQLQDSVGQGTRLSRLPPLTVESPLMLQGRSDYFRSMSTDGESDTNASPRQYSPTGLGVRAEVEDSFTPADRPRSMHPRVSRVPPTPDGEVPAMPPSLREANRGRQLQHIQEDRDILGSARQRSPSPLRYDNYLHNDTVREVSAVRRGSRSPLSSQAHYSNDSPGKTRQDLGHDPRLALPQPAYPDRSSSVFSSPSLPPTDDDSTSNLILPTYSLPPRKLSSSSAAYANYGPTPSLGSLRRTLSIESDSSALPRPSFNFSRPMSRSGTPTFDPPSRQASSDSHPSFLLTDDSVQTPISMTSESLADQQHLNGGPNGTASSYIYSKFSLPRGKTLQRSEGDEDEATPSPHGEQPVAQHGSVQHLPTYPPPSPGSRPSSSSARTAPGDWARPSIDARTCSFDVVRVPAAHSSPISNQPSNDSFRSSEDRSRGRGRAPRGRSPPSAKTSDTASTIRPPPAARSMTSSTVEMSAEEHLAKGIQCHEDGSLNESTYHLRLAARMDNPTAMLLYALACRHGWGMRANEREAVQWLRKAAEHASVEIADDEDQVKDGKHVDVLDRRTHKAQFALSIYELGVSHMNGWGIEQDKALALRCFEIAGSKFQLSFGGLPLDCVVSTLTVAIAWGDVDALAEAGFCYAQGVGCKKDLKKSARFYRSAEAKGMSMVGNSWCVTKLRNFTN